MDIQLLVKGYCVTFPYIFTIQMDEPFDDALMTFCDAYEIDIEEVIFMCDGEVIDLDNTPEDYGLLDGDYIVCIETEVENEDEDETEAS